MSAISRWLSFLLLCRAGSLDAQPHLLPNRKGRRLHLNACLRSLSISMLTSDVRSFWLSFGSASFWLSAALVAWAPPEKATLRITHTLRNPQSTATRICENPFRAPESAAECIMWTRQYPCVSAVDAVHQLGLKSVGGIPGRAEQAPLGTQWTPLLDDASFLTREEWWHDHQSAGSSMRSRFQAAFLLYSVSP